MSMCALHGFRNARDAFLQIRSLRQKERENHYPEIALPELPASVPGNHSASGTGQTAVPRNCQKPKIF